ncbi:hypothetical protein FQA47_014425 [Oryzias melastigma]|uniref:Uncharacterized protein n=1 Tax=Oryzias melastigma TaxID=30732 RepID=A0A834F806_ORYME|nr:hypothetical protein FQA47_014425 [Oryzias melastigma]
MDLIFAVLGLLALLVDSIRCQGVYGAQAAHQPGDRGSEFRPQGRDAYHAESVQTLLLVSMRGGKAFFTQNGGD